MCLLYLLGDSDQIQRYSDNRRTEWHRAGVCRCLKCYKNGIHDVVATSRAPFWWHWVRRWRAHSGVCRHDRRRRQSRWSGGTVDTTKVTLTVDYKQAETLQYWLTAHDYQLWRPRRHGSPSGRASCLKWNHPNFKRHWLIFIGNINFKLVKNFLWNFDKIGYNWIVMIR